MPGVGGQQADRQTSISIRAVSRLCSPKISSSQDRIAVPELNRIRPITSSGRRSSPW
jgi:hypothetical protein